MSEAEFNLVLDAVRDAMTHENFAPSPEKDFVPRSLSFDPTPKKASKEASKKALKAANDNEGAWPLVPFPDGWYAAC